jgi:hypothetical protein
MEVLGVVLAALATIVIVYLVVYTIPRLLMRFVRAMKRRRAERRISEDLDSTDTYEIYISLRAV